MNISKYTLFSAYSASANANMTPVPFDILFGNEDKENWIKFWTFAVKIHPSIYSPDVTILSDQDNGSIAAVKQCVPQPFHFHCAWHSHQKIIKTCGAGGNAVYSTLWTYNLLLKCKALPSITRAVEEHPQMHPTDFNYLTTLEDAVQYPAARCAMGDNVCMYSLSASSGGESMNRANNPARKVTAVDMLNAAMLLTCLESKRYKEFKIQVHNTSTPLTLCGMQLWEEAFKGIECIDYTCTFSILETCYQCSVSKVTENASIYTVKIPKTEVFGSRFVSCTCGMFNVMAFHVNTWW